MIEFTEISVLKKQIAEIENGEEYNYALVKVVPDCCGGIRDNQTIIAISEDIDSLQNYLVVNIEGYDHPISLESEQPSGVSPCDIWYTIQQTDIQLV